MSIENKRSTLEGLENWYHGFLFIDKPKGCNSTYIVYEVKKYLKSIGLKDLKVGHGGTLDPFAEGALPIAIGEATKAIDYVMDTKKIYEFTIQFGIETDTYDNTGKIVNISDKFPSIQAVEGVLSLFTGEINQIPPRFSAIKLQGKRAYDLARDEKEFIIPKRSIFIQSLELLNYNTSRKTVCFRAIVGKGTYIRSLGVDIARKLNCLGCVSYLRRVGYVFNQEIELIPHNMTYNLQEQLISIEDLLDDISAYPLDQNEALLLLNGNVKLNKNFVTNNSNSNIIKAVYNNKLIALLRVNNKQFTIIRVFNHHKKLLDKERTDVTYKRRKISNNQKLCPI